MNITVTVELGDRTIATIERLLAAIGQAPTVELTAVEPTATKPAAVEPAPRRGRRATKPAAEPTPAPTPTPEPLGPALTEGGPGHTEPTAPAPTTPEPLGPALTEGGPGHTEPAADTMSITDLRNLATQLSIKKDPVGAENREKIKAFLIQHKLGAMSELSQRPDLAAAMGELLMSLK